MEDQGALWEDVSNDQHLRVVLDLPPSDNHIYVNRGNKGRFLSRDARTYKNKALSVIASIVLSSGAHRDFHRDMPYEVEILLFMPVFNSTFPKSKFLFKKSDTLNRTKLLIDIVTEAISVDDRHIVDVTVRKRHSTCDTGVIIEITEASWLFSEFPAI